MRMNLNLDIQWYSLTEVFTTRPTEHNHYKSKQQPSPPPYADIWQASWSSLLLETHIIFCVLPDASSRYLPKLAQIKMGE